MASLQESLQVFDLEVLLHLCKCTPPANTIKPPFLSFAWMYQAIIFRNPGGSGAKIAVDKKKRAFLAGVHWFFSILFRGELHSQSDPGGPP